MKRHWVYDYEASIDVHVIHSISKSIYLYMYLYMYVYVLKCWYPICRWSSCGISWPGLGSKCQWRRRPCSSTVPLTASTTPLSAQCSRPIRGLATIPLYGSSTALCKTRAVPHSSRSNYHDHPPPQLPTIQLSYTSHQPPQTFWLLSA